MTRTLLLAVAAAAVLAAPTLANDQLALSSGLEPGVYTTAELSILRQARQDDDELLYRTTMERALARRAAEVLPPQGGLGGFNPGPAMAFDISEGPN